MTGPQYARGTKAWGLCKRCGLRFLLSELVLDEHMPGLRVCIDCFDTKQPQEFPIDVSDPQALWKPSPEDHFHWTLDVPPLDATFVAEDFPMTAAFNSGGIDIASQPSDVYLVASAQNLTVSGTVTPTMPAGIATGDLLIWVIEGNILGTPQYDMTGWRRLSKFTTSGAINTNDSPLFNEANGLEMIYWKFASSASETMPSFTYAQTHSHLVFAFRNVSREKPFRDITVFGEGAANIGRTYALWGQHFASSHNLRFNKLGEDGTTAGGAFTLTLSDAPHFELDVNYGALGRRDTFYACKGASHPAAHNLLQPTALDTYGTGDRFFAGAGTPVGGSISQNSNILTTTKFDTFYVGTATTSRHYVPWTVNLVAGQKYTLVVDAAWSNTATYAAAITVHDGTTEFGGTYEKDNATLSKLTTVGGGFAFEGMDFTPTQNDSGFSGSSSRKYILCFTASVTGPHEIRVGNCDNAGTLSYLGTTSDRFALNYLGVHAGHGLPGLRGGPASTTDYAGLGPLYVKSSMGTGPSIGGWSMELNHLSFDQDTSLPYAPPVLLSRYTGRNHGPQVDYSTGKTIYQNGSDWCTAGTHFNVDYCGVANQPVMSNTVAANVGGKYYFEVTIGATLGTRNPSAGAVGVVLWDAQIQEGVARIEASSTGTLTDTSKAVGSLTYARSGNVYNQSNVVSQTLPTFAPGDIIGVALDLSTGNGSAQFYKNGVAVGTPENLFGLGLPYFAATSFGGRDGAQANVCNFAGPFGGRKPTGYAAYDYRNEVA